MYKKICLTLYFVLALSCITAGFSSAAVVVWDGGGGDNNWSTGANWVGDVAPTSSDVATFNGTSTKDATYDASFTSWVNGINIASGYTGTITAARTVVIVGGGSFTQAAGTFNGSNQIMQTDHFNLSGGVFNSTSNIFYILYNFSITGGTFNHNGGTLNFQYASSTAACNNAVFNLVVIQKNSTGDSITVGSDCTFPLGSNPTSYGSIINNGTITVTGSGTWSHDGTLRLNSGSTLNMNTTTTLTMPNRDLILNGGTWNASALTTLNVSRGTLTLTSLANTFPSSVTTMTIGGSLNNSNNMLHDGITLSMTYAGGTLTCGDANFSSVNISLNSTGDAITVASDCDIDLPASPSTQGQITNNGIINVTGDWVHSSSFTIGSGSTLNFSASTDTWTLTGGNLTLNGGSWNTTSSFTHLHINNGSLIYNSLATQFPQTITTMTIGANLDNSSNFLPNGIDLTLVYASGTLTCGNAVFDSLIVQRASVSDTLSFGSNCTIGSFLHNQGNINNPSSAYTLYVTGNYTEGVSATTGGSNLTVEFSGSADQNITQNAGTFASKFRVNKTSGNAILLTNFTVTTQTCTISSGTLDLDGKNFTCGSTFTVANNANLSLHGSETVTTPTLSVGSNVNYLGDDDNASDSYTLKSWDYSNININSQDSTSDSFYLGTETTIGNIFNLSNGTFYQKSLVNDPYQLITSSFNQYAGVYNGSTALLNVNGTFILSGGTFNAPSTLHVSGDFSNSGTFVHNSGIVHLDGTNQTISGSTTFYDFSKIVATASTLIFPETPDIQTFLGTMTLQGASGQLLSLRSSTDGIQAEIDPQSTREVEYLDVQDNYNINATEIDITGANITDSGNNTGWGFNDLPVATTPAYVSQANNGTGYVTVTTSLSDDENSNTKLKVEYSDDGGTSWYDPFLVSATPSSGSVDLDNGQSYQIGSVNNIDTSGGSVTLTLVWNTQSASNGNGSLDDINQSDIRIRVTPNDNTEDGLTVSSANFSVDNLDPADLENLSATTVSISEVSLDWDIATEANFDHYEVWYGTNSTDVSNRTGTATEWDNSDDSDLATIATDTTSIGSLTPATLYYFKIWAVDDYGNELTTASASSTTIADNASPEIPTSLGPTAVIDAGWERDTTPTFTFTLSDSDVTDQVKYRIQVDTDSDFSSPVIDYTSSLSSQGSQTYTVTSALTDANYYWRVKTIDDSGAESSYATANSGNIAFKLDATSPSKPSTPRVSDATDGETTDNTPKWKWDASTDTNSGVDYYEVMWSTDNSFDDADEDETDSNSFTNDNLDDDKWYFRVRARDNAENYSSWSNYGAITIDATAPEITSISYDIYTNKIDISWKTNEEVVTKIDWGLTDSYGTNYEDNDETTSHSATLSNLNANTTHYIQITAEDALGNTSQSQLTIKTAVLVTLPNTPTTTTPTVTEKPAESITLEPTVISNIRATTTGETQVTITWTTNHPATSEVDFGLSTNFTEQRMDQTKKTSHRIVIDGLDPQTTYYYEIISVGNTTAVNAFRTFSTKDVMQVPNVTENPVVTAPTETSYIFNALFVEPGIFGAFEMFSKSLKDRIYKYEITFFSQLIKTLENIAFSKSASVGAFLFTSFSTLIQLAGPNLIGTLEALRSISIWNWPSIIAGLIRKKKNPWGVVYDSVTHEPLDPVVLTLTDKLGKTYQAVSDIYGRYEFLVEPGEYYLKAEKGNYSFPPSSIDTLIPNIYDDNYFGGLISIGKDQKVSFNIPMENIAKDWNQEEKRRMGISRQTNIIYTLASYIYYLGVLWSMVAVVLAPILINILVFISYFLLALFRKRSLSSKPWGVIKNKLDEPVKGAIVRLVNADIPQLKFPPLVTNSTGKYNFLVEKGNYRIGVQTKKSDGTYDFAYKSKVISTKKPYDNIGFDVSLWD